MPAGGSEDVTLGEVARNLDALAKQMERGFDQVNERFNGLSMVHADVYLADRHTDHERRQADLARVEVIEGRVGRIEGNISWLGRALLGSMIVAVITIIVAASGFPH